MPAFNTAQDIRESISSVLSQTFTALELIVIDDASTDNTASIIEEFRRVDPRVILLRNPSNQGVSFSRNRGLRNVRGRYLMFLDSDDVWTEWKVEHQVAFMKSSGCPVCYMDYSRFKDSEPDRKWLVRAPRRLSFEDLLVSNEIGMLTAAIDLKKIKRLPCFRNQGHEDYLFWLEVLREVAPQPALKVSAGHPAADYRERDGSVSSNHLRAAVWHWNIISEQELSIFLKIACMFRYAISAFAKRSRFVNTFSP